MSPPFLAYSPNSELLALRERNAELVEENRQLLERKFPRIKIRYRGVIFTPTEEIIFHALLEAPKGTVSTPEYLLEYVVRNRNIYRPTYEAPTDNAVKIFIHRVRKKLKSTSKPIRIFTDWGVGYYIPEEDKIIAKELEFSI